MVGVTKSVMEFNKKDALAALVQKENEVEKWQREYWAAVSAKTNSRKAVLLYNSNRNTKHQLIAEKNELKAKIWVASAKIHKTNSNVSIRKIKCHLSCQELLSEENQRLKSSIANLNREICNCNKTIYELKRKLVRQSKLQSHMEMTAKWARLLEDRLETIVNQECSFCAKTEVLRQSLVARLNARRQFNQQYTKLMQKLTTEKKYLMELIDYALGKFENCIEVFERTEIVSRRHAIEFEQRKVEMEGHVRNAMSTEERTICQIIKMKERTLGDLQPKEYKRRASQRIKYQKKIAVYEDVLEKILNYTRVRNVDRVIDKFLQQESLYYSYFNYANEMSYHMTLLNNSVSRLYTDINGLKLMNRNNFQHQMETINHLYSILEQKKTRNEKLKKILNEHNERIEKLFEGMQLIRDQTNTGMPPKRTFEEFSTINPKNMRSQLKLIEKRISSIVAITFVLERMNAKGFYHNFLVREIGRVCDWPTELDEIVLTQQCPECAESDDFYMDDAETCAVLPLQKIKKKLYDKVVQPEMQYRLHSISECRLPRARLLVSRRHN